MRPNELSSRRRSTPKRSSFGKLTDTVSRSVRNVVNKSKKDDDYRSINDIQGKVDASNQSWLQKLADCNPIVIIVGAVLAVMLVLVLIVFFFVSIFSSAPAVDTSSSSAYNNPRSKFNEPVYSYRKEATPELNTVDPHHAAKSRMEIDRLIKEMKRSADDIESSMYHDVDTAMSDLMHTYCINELPFEMDSSSKSTFEAHISYLFSAIIDHEEIVADLNPDNVIVTEWGTLNDVAHHPAHVKYGRCSLVQELLVRAKKEELLHRAADTAKDTFEDTFAKTNDDIWFEHKTKFLDTDVNEAAYQMIELLKDDGEHLHIAKQLLPKLLNYYCPNVVSFLDQQDGDKDLLFELVNSVEDLLTQLHHHGNIHVSKSEIPAVDKGGFLVAVDKFSLDQSENFDDHWSTCNFIDKLVYYHNKPIKEQVESLVEEVKDHNYYAFENQVDMMMLEHCPSAVHKLTVKKSLTETSTNVYLSVFRGEFTSYVSKVANNEIVVSNANDIVVADNGGIVHKWAATTGYSECPILKEVALLSNEAEEASANEDNQVEPVEHVEFDEHMFDPEYHDAAWDQWDQELHHEKKLLESDARNIVQHAVDNEQYKLTHLVTNMLYLYHSSDILRLSQDQIEHLTTEVNQYIQAFLDVSKSVTWPAKHRAVLDIENARLLLLDEDNEKLQTGHKIVSDLFTECFKLALEKGVSPSPHFNQDNAYKPPHEPVEELHEVHEIPKQKEEVKDPAEQDSKLQSYVKLLLQDARRAGTDPADIRRDVESDVNHYCPDMWKALDSRARRVLMSQLMDIVQTSGKRITYPVVDESGYIKALNQAHYSEKTYTCTFVAEVIAQQT